MPDTTFVLGTVVQPDWLNYVNRLAHDAQTAGSATKGPALLPYSYSLAYAAGTVGAKLREFVSVKDMGAIGDGVANDTAALQAVIDSGATMLYFPPGTYSISSLLVASKENVTFVLHNAIIKSRAGTSATALIEIKNCRSIHIEGFQGGILDGNLNVDLTCLVKMWADNGGGSSYHRISGVRFRYAHRGVINGDPARGSEPYISESSLLHCDFIGVLNPVSCYGIQGELNCVGCFMTAGAYGWTTLPASPVRYALLAVGGNIRVTGGELTAYDSEAINIRPIASTSGNIYGKVFCTGTWIEVQSALATFQNPAALAPLETFGMLHLHQCMGFLADDNLGAIDTAADFPGEIRVLECYFWAGATRTMPNINSGSLATIITDEMSWNNGYKNGLGAFTGGKLVYEGRRYDSGPPGAGAWTVGDIVYDSTPSASGFIGWVCTASGTPGTWKTFGAISA